MFSNATDLVGRYGHLDRITVVDWAKEVSVTRENYSGQATSTARVLRWIAQSPALPKPGVHAAIHVG